jgi:hypothetical protein
MVKNLKWLGAAFEAFLGIPILGGLFIIGMGILPSDSCSSITSSC